MRLMVVFALSFMATAAHAEKIEVPIDIGVGPAGVMWNGPISADQSLHYALSISGGAVLDKALIKKNGKRIPKKYRRMAKSLDEVRIGHILIPDTLIISPQLNNTGIYGVSWSPLKLGVPLVKKPFRLKLTANPVFTYAFIHSNQPQIGSMHFARPGLAAGASLEFKLFGPLRCSLHARTQLYVPQATGGSVADLGLTDNGLSDNAIWHVEQFALRIHYRFPYRTRL